MDSTRNVIKRAKDYLGTLPYGPGSAAFMFAQVRPCIIRVAATLSEVFAGFLSRVSHHQVSCVNAAKALFDIGKALI